MSGDGTDSDRTPRGTSTSGRRTRRIVNVGVALGIALVMGYGCLPWDSYRYRAAPLVGLSPQQVGERLGKPYFDGRTDRQPDGSFVFGYIGRGGLLGKTYVVKFREERCVGVEDLGMK